MQTKPFDLNQNFSQTELIKTEFTFSPFLKYLIQRKPSKFPIKNSITESLINIFKEQDSLSRPEMSAMSKKTDIELLELVFSALSPVLVNEEDHLWALSPPVPNRVLYCTDAFSLLASNELAKESVYTTSDYKGILKEKYINYIYRLILNRCYHISISAHDDEFYSHQDEQTGLYRYYKIHVDTTFVDIEAITELPSLWDDLDQISENDDPLSDIKKILPLDHFILKGFTVLTLVDCTQEYILDQIRAAYLDHTNDQGTYKEVTQYLKALSGDCGMEFGLTPVIQLHGQFLFDNNVGFGGILIELAKQKGFEDDHFQHFMQGYEKNPVTLFFTQATRQHISCFPYEDALKAKKFSVYACIPLIFQQKLVGIMEVYSAKDILFFEDLFTRVYPAMPHLCQLLKNSIDNCHEHINAVVREQFTALQTSVMWKFDQLAWSYIQSERQDSTRIQIGKVCFEEIYPLYGAIDIKDSTSKRNKALHADLLYLLNETSNYLSVYRQVNPQFALLQVHCKRWTTAVFDVATADDHKSIIQFLYNEVKPLVLQEVEKEIKFSAATDAFLQLIDAAYKGDLHAESSRLEGAIAGMNTMINNMLLEASLELQAIFPSYFEPFRTDGVEYDIYM